MKYGCTVRILKWRSNHSKGSRTKGLKTEKACHIQKNVCFPYCFYQLQWYYELFSQDYTVNKKCYLEVLCCLHEANEFWRKQPQMCEETLLAAG